MGVRETLGMLALTVAPAVSAAQEAADGERKSERIEVTGSNIKRVDSEGPAPLLVLRREDIALRAGQNLQEILIGLPYANAGSTAETRLTSAAGISLRGLGADSTLVLVNGRRVAVHGFADRPLGVAFVDLNAIPTTAIERIEILKDGASAIYGSDAIAGVVNVVLRRDFHGTEVTASYGQSARGDSADARAALTAGTGQLARDGFNATVTLEYYHRDPLEASQRERSRDADQRARGGFDWRQTQGRPGTWLTDGRGGFAANTPMPGCPAELLANALTPAGACAFNENAYLVLYPRTQRKSVFGRAEVALSPRISAFVDASWMQAETETGGVPAADTVRLPAGHNSNPFPFEVPTLYRWLEVGRRLSMTDARTTRLVAGIEGNHRGIDFDAAFNRVEAQAYVDNLNQLTVADRNALRDGNVYDFVDPSRNDPAMVDAIRTSTWRSRNSTLESVDGKASGIAYELPAGPLRAAAGVERRRERLSSASNQTPGTFVNLSADTHEAGSRTVTALFAEAIVPLLPTIEAQVAVRRERYSDFGDSTAPKIALAWRPAASFMLRAGYGEGFRAPSLVQLYLDRRTQVSAVIDTPRCNAYRAAFGDGDSRTQSVCNPQQINTALGGNPALHAEESTNKTFGLVMEPAQGVSIAVDAFEIRQHGRVVAPGSDTILMNEDAFPGAVLRDPPGANDVLAGARGPIAGARSDSRIGISGYFINSGALEVRGVDLELRWRLRLGRGTLRLDSLNTYLHSMRSADAPGLPEVERAGGALTPRYRGWHSASWMTSPWTVSAVVNAVGPSAQFPGAPSGHENVASWITVDLQAVYAGLRDAVLTAGVRNVADRAPPFFNDVLGFDETTHSLVGRFFYGRAMYRFR